MAGKNNGGRRKPRRGNQPSRRRPPAGERDASSITPQLRYQRAPLWLCAVLPLFVGVCAYVTYRPALDAEFVNWDDDKVVTDNPHFRGMTTDNLKWMFTQTKMGHYHPLTWLSYSVDHAIGERRYESQSAEAKERYDNGLDPVIFHRTNLLLHAGAAVAFYFLAALLLRLVLPPPPDRPDVSTPLAATLAALLFACHPLRVENAVWVTERRDVLSAIFLLPCLYCYLRYALVDRWRGGKIAWYVASVVLLALSLLSKAWGITLPAVMLVLDVHPLKRIGGKAGWTGSRSVTAYLDKIPFVILAICFAVWAKEAQGDQLTTMKTLEEWGVGDRISQAFHGFFYSYKTVLPVRLTPLVPLPPDNNPLALRYIVAAVIVVAVAAALLLLRKRWPAGVVLAVCYAGVLSPILGIAQSGPQLVADKYAYLACLTWAVLGGAGLLWLWRNRERNPRAARAMPWACAAAILVCVTYAWLARQQSKVWQNSHQLWSHAVNLDPRCVTARLNLGLLERKAGNRTKAIEHYEAALAVDPDVPILLNNLAVALREDPARLEELIAISRRAVELQPKLPDLRYSLAKALQEAGKLDEAVAEFKTCVKLKSGQPKFHRALGTIYKKRKQYDAAEKQYIEVLRLELKLNKRGRGVINALDRLGWIMIAEKRTEEAVDYFKQILKIDPDNKGAKKGIARARRAES